MLSIRVNMMIPEQAEKCDRNMRADLVQVYEIKQDS